MIYLLFFYNNEINIIILLILKDNNNFNLSLNILTSLYVYVYIYIRSYESKEQGYIKYIYATKEIYAFVKI